MDPLSCSQARELCSAEIDGELEPREAERLAGHLALCTGCRHARGRSAWERGEKR